LITGKSGMADIFQKAMNQVCIFLAKGIARDGEGATKLIEVNVKSAATLKEARQAARTIVGSNLVKAAIYGNDPNWGRVTAALAEAAHSWKNPNWTFTWERYRCSNRASTFL